MAEQNTAGNMSEDRPNGSSGSMEAMMLDDLPYVVLVNGIVSPILVGVTPVPPESVARSSSE